MSAPSLEIVAATLAVGLAVNRLGTGVFEAGGVVGLIVELSTVVVGIILWLPSSGVITLFTQVPKGPSREHRDKSHWATDRSEHATSSSRL